MSVTDTHNEHFVVKILVVSTACTFVLVRSEEYVFNFLNLSSCLYLTSKLEHIPLN